MTPRPARAGADRGARRLIGVLCLLALACESRPTAGHARAGALPSPRPTASAEARKPAARAPLEFIEFVTGGANPADRLPLIVAIHGLGDEPQSFSSVLRSLPVPARVLVPAGLTRHGRGFSWFPFRDDRSADELARGLRAATDRVADFLRWAREHRPTRGLPMITGFSQGGMISFDIAVAHPALVSAAFPMGGLLPRPLWPSAGAPSVPPVVAFHGEDDPVVPFDGAMRTVAELGKTSHQVRLERYPGVRHAVPPAMRRDLYGAIATALDALDP